MDDSLWNLIEKTIWGDKMIKELMYIELKTGYSDDGPAWICKNFKNQENNLFQ